MTTAQHDWRRWIWQVTLAAGAVSTLLRGGLYMAGIAESSRLVINIAATWVIVLTIGWIATRRAHWIGDWIQHNRERRLAAVARADRLELQNSLLETIASSADTSLALNALARRIDRIVPCDRIGLALLKPNGQEFHTITARVSQEERRSRPRPDLEFAARGSIVGAVVASREPTVVGDLARLAPDYLDANVLNSSGFRSAVVLPLITKGRTVGTFSVVSRRLNAFDGSHVEALTSVAEILAVAHVAQQLQLGVARLKTTETMAELILAVANDINGALQTIVGHCDLLEREYPDPSLRRDLGTIVRQAHRVFDLLKKMRDVTEERMREVAATVSDAEK